MKTIKAGVIGVGYLGKFHAQKYADMEDVELVGVSDTNEQTVKAISDDLGCRPFLDYHDMLPLVDAVSIAVPTSFHHQVAAECIEAGIDILLEKPMTVTLEEADDLIIKASRKKTILQVGHLERFNPAVEAMEPFLEMPMFIESDRIHIFKNRAVDVDVVLDLMIHDIDIILSIIDSPIKTIHTVGAPVVTETTDLANARIIFENGATANVTVSRIAKTNVRKMRIFQPGSYITVDFANRKVMTIHLKEELEESGMPKQDIEIKEFTEGDALKSEILHFVDNVRNRTQPSVSGIEGRRALGVALQVIKQIEEYQKIIAYESYRVHLKRK